MPKPKTIKHNQPATSPYFHDDNDGNGPYILIDPACIDDPAYRAIPLEEIGKAHTDALEGRPSAIDRWLLRSGK